MCVCSFPVNTLRYFAVTGQFSALTGQSNLQRMLLLALRPARPASAWRPKCQITACQASRRHGGEAEISKLSFMSLYVVVEKGQDVRSTPPAQMRRDGTVYGHISDVVSSRVLIMVWLHRTWSRSTGGKRSIRTDDKRG